MSQYKCIFSNNEFNEKLRISLITEKWFWNEPMLYSVLATHQIVPNSKMGCTMRTGQGRIEFNAEFTQKYDDATLEKLLRVEVMRIILKHPYSRRPDETRDDACLCASDVTITQNCNIHYVSGEIMTAQMFQIPEGYCYEEYCKILTQLFGNLPPSESAEKSKINSSSNENSSNDSKDVDENNTDKNGNTGKSSGGSGNQDLQSISENAQERSELWEEDPLMEEIIQEEVERNYREKHCGSVPGNFIQDIIANKKPKLHYKKILSQFRTMLVSDKRKLTRMKPSRRYGFKQMGYRYDYTINILVAVDTSGSISDSDLRKFFSIINQFFKNGVKQLDVIQFDHEIQGEVQSLKKQFSRIRVRGRGGTSFQPAYNYCAEHKEYNGLIFLTDGYASEPKVPDSFNTRVVWVIDNKYDYVRNSWLKKFGFVTYIEDLQQ